MKKAFWLAIGAVLLILALLLAYIFYAYYLRPQREASSKAKSRIMQAKKARDDCAVLSVQLAGLYKQWKATHPTPEEFAAEVYDVALVIDLEKEWFYLERGGVLDNTALVRLPDGYEWKLLYATPGGSADLGGVARLRLKGHMQQTNTYQEVIGVQGTLGAEAGINVAFQPGNGAKMSIGTGRGDWSECPFGPRLSGRNTVSESLLVLNAY